MARTIDPSIYFSPSPYLRRNKSSTMTGSILITGANGSLAIPAVDHLLKNYPDMTAILTVRKTSAEDANTKRLQETIARHSGAKASIHLLDLASLESVASFANTISTDIASGKYPQLTSIVCNAYHWNLVSKPKFTDDGYEKTMQVSHISHVSLIMRLLGSFAPDEPGRIILFSSNGHWPGKNPFERYHPAIPDSNLDQLVKGAVPYRDDMYLGFQRYATAKLIITAWMYALNQ